MSDPIRVTAVTASLFHLALDGHADRLLGGAYELTQLLAGTFSGVGVSGAPGQPSGRYLVRLAPAALPSGCHAVDAIHSALSLELIRQQPSTPQPLNRGPRP